jgi:hypothetical protein
MGQCVPVLIVKQYSGKPRTFGEQAFSLACQSNLKQYHSEFCLFRIKAGFCNRTRDLTNDAGYFLPQKVQPISLHRFYFLSRKTLVLARLGPHAYCKIRVTA